MQGPSSKLLDSNNSTSFVLLVVAVKTALCYLLPFPCYLNVPFSFLVPQYMFN